MGRESIKLSWEPTGVDGRGRYRKMFMGRRFPSRIYPCDSRRNKSEAWSHFLAWREQIKAELEAEKESALASDPIRLDTAEKVRVMRNVAELISDRAGAKFADNLLQMLERVDDDGVAEIREELELNDDSDAMLTVGRKLVQAKGELEPNTDYAAQVIVDRYMTTLKTKVITKQKGGSVGIYGQTRSALNLFLDWFGASRGLDILDQKDVIEYHTHLLGMLGQKSQTTLHTYQKLWRSFVKHVANDYDDISVPKNLDDKRYIIRAGNSKLVAFTVGECKTLLSLASPRVELWLLLMLNCGMYQGDISDLLSEEVDWEGGRIIRARSKEENAPTINWLLWDRTWELLKDQGNRNGVTLLKQNGESLVTSGIKENGMEWRRDAIVSSWRHLVKKAKRREGVAQDWHKTLKQFRKTSSSLIESGPHAEFVDMFLDHSRVARRHYLVGQVVPKFDEAVKWLGEQVGLATIR